MSYLDSQLAELHGSLTSNELWYRECRTQEANRERVVYCDECESWRSERVIVWT